MATLLNSILVVVTASYRYRPSEKLLAQSGSLTQPFGFSTKRYDAQTGLIYYGYRSYSPAIGRWTTRDPLGEAGGLNLYAFVGNNPVNWVDPWGEDAGVISGPVILGVGGLIGGYLACRAGGGCPTPPLPDAVVNFPGNFVDVGSRIHAAGADLINEGISVFTRSGEKPRKPDPSEIKKAKDDLAKNKDLPYKLREVHGEGPPPPPGVCEALWQTVLDAKEGKVSQIVGTIALGMWYFAGCDSYYRSP